MQLTKEQIINTLRRDKAFLQNELGIAAIALFGSYARTNQQENSDIDFLVEQKETNAINLFKTVYFIQEKFPDKKIQITRKGPHLSGRFLESIKRDLIYV